MPEVEIGRLANQLLVVFAVGVVSGVICKRLGVSLIAGYMVAGVLAGEGGLGLLNRQEELEYLAGIGALLLLFSVGMEFSLDELRHFAGYFFLGGTIQMATVAVPAILLLKLTGRPWPACVLIGFAVSLSSTVLVFRGLAEWGQLATPVGRRALAILLFQDVALVPLMLIIPIFAGMQDDVGPWSLLRLAGTSALFLAVVGVATWVTRKLLLPMLVRLKSAELLVLFTLALLIAYCLLADVLGLTPAIGAIAAGVSVAGTRVSRQVDSIVLPFREAFATLFFVTLGALLQVASLLADPLSIAVGLGVVLVLKAAAASLALVTTGVQWRAAIPAGIGLSQLGEFSFVLLASATHAQVVAAEDYERVLIIALVTLILTPQLIKIGFSRALQATEAPEDRRHVRQWSLPHRAVVIGMGIIGRQVASRLETLGIDVCAIDFSALNLYPFAQQGFATVAGDAQDVATLQRARVDTAELVVVTVPDDASAKQIVTEIRKMNRQCRIVVRCRYASNIRSLKRLGADEVVSEEALAANEMLARISKWLPTKEGTAVGAITKT